MYISNKLLLRISDPNVQRNELLNIIISQKNRHTWDRLLCYVAIGKSCNKTMNRDVERAQARISALIVHYNPSL